MGLSLHQNKLNYEIFKTNHYEVKRKVMKIGHLIDQLSIGGAQRVVSELTKNVFDSDTNYIFLISESSVTFPANGKIIILKQLIKTSNSRFASIINFIYYTFQIRQYKNKLGLDVLISHLEYFNIMNLLSLSKVKTIVCIHSTKSIEIKSMGNFHSIIHTIAIKYLYKYSYKVLAVSKGIKLDLIHNFSLKESNIEVVYIPFNIEDVLNMSKINSSSFIKKRGIFRIVTVGRLEEEKNIEVQIRCFKEFNKEFTNSELVIIGSGSLRGELEDLVDSLQLRSKVAFIGFKVNPYKIMSTSDVLLVTSKYEGLSAVIIESMIVKTAVISVDCPSGPKELICNSENNTDSMAKVTVCDFGILIPPIKSNKDYKSLLEALKLLYINKDLKNVLVNKAFVRAKDFSHEIIASRWRKILD